MRLLARAWVLNNMKKRFLRTLLVSALALLSGHSAFAENLRGALAKAYVNNSALNSDRASVRVYDEDVAIAKSGYRPQISGFGSYSRGRTALMPVYITGGSIGIQLNQKIFDGFVTKNSVAAAKTQAQAQREFLRNSEQNLLFAAVSAYADVYAARRIVAYRAQNLAALEEQVRSSKARLEVGDGTRTDLAQSEAQRSQAISQLAQARANAKSKEATYRRIVGENPENLDPPPAAAALPQNLDRGLFIASMGHPAILSAKYAVDAASYAVKVKEGTLLPRIDATAGTSYNEVYKGPHNSEGRANSVGLQLSVPIYQGGALSAQVRQSKERLGQAEIQVDSIRDQVREQLVSAWAQLEGARYAAAAYRDSVDAAKIAFDGRVQENMVGQATTLDVLHSRSILIDAEVGEVNVERDVIVAGYAVQVAVGRMNVDDLHLPVRSYNAKEHYDAVRNKIIGVNTPDGR